MPAKDWSLPHLSRRPQGTTTRRGASLRRIIGHLTAATDGAPSLPAALADGTGGTDTGRWQGLEFINGTRYSDLKQAFKLEDLNTVYGPQQWRQLPQQEVLGLTDSEADVDWLSSIKEEVRPKRKAKKRSTPMVSGKRKSDRGAHRDSPGKQRKGEQGTLARAAPVTPILLGFGRGTPGFHPGGCAGFDSRSSELKPAQPWELKPAAGIRTSTGTDADAVQWFRSRCPLCQKLEGEKTGRKIAHESIQVTGIFQEISVDSS